MVLPYITALIFLTVFCLFMACYQALLARHTSPKAELKRRLRLLASSGVKELPEELRGKITRETRPADTFFARLPVTANLDKKLDRAGLKVTVSSFIMASATLALSFAALVTLITRGALWGLLALAGSVLLVNLYLFSKTELRKDRFTELFPDALAMISRSLRAGHSFTSCVQLVGEEIPSPVGELFKTAFNQQQLGLRMIDTLVNLNERIESLDLRFFTTVIGINAEIGGNLSEVLDKLAVTIRERLRIRRQVKAYTAQGRMSGYVVGVLPIVAFFAFNILDPDYESVLLKEPMGACILAFAAGMQLIGLLLMRSIIKIKI